MVNGEGDADLALAGISRRRETLARKERSGQCEILMLFEMKIVVPAFVIEVFVITAVPLFGALLRLRRGIAHFCRWSFSVIAQRKNAYHQKQHLHCEPRMS